MKSLKTLGILLLIILVAALTLNFVAPKDVDITETMIINADKKMVFDKVKSLSAIRGWQTEFAVDSVVQVDVIGTDGAVGALLKWSSEDRRIGDGELVMDEVTPHTMVRLTETKVEPMKIKMNKFIALEDLGGHATKVTWSIHTHVGFPDNILFHFNGNAMRKDLVDELILLNGLVTSGANAMPIEDTANHPSKPAKQYKVVEVERPQMTYMMIRQKVGLDKMDAFIRETTPELYPIITASGAEVSGYPSALVFDWNEEGNVADMAVAVPVRGAVPGNGVAVFEQPKATCLKITYRGLPEDSYGAHAFMDGYMKTHHYEQNGIVVEEYPTDISKMKDPTMMQTDIYYYVKKK